MDSIASMIWGIEGCKRQLSLIPTTLRLIYFSERKLKPISRFRFTGCTRDLYFITQGMKRDALIVKLSNQNIEKRICVN